jgi:peptidoglycan/xylan/chitin deacetylase (PgdA/CDA1 family)
MPEKYRLSRKDFIGLSVATILALLLRPLLEAVSHIHTPAPLPLSTSTRDILTKRPTQTETSTSTKTPTITPTKQEINLLTPEKIDFLANHPINHGRTDEKIVIMTYDEGIIPANVEHLLDIYKTIGGKCTFFMTGVGLEQSKDLLTRIIDEGHVIGCHGYEHINLAELADEKITEQFKMWFEKFRSILPDYQVNFFRAPSGSYNTRVLKIAASFGLQHVLWNVESGGMNPDTLKNVFDGFQRYQNYYQAVGGAIILSHTMRYYDISQAEDIVNKWSDLGYQLVTIDQGKMESDTWKG